MNELKEFLAELNFYDSSVGIHHCEDINEVAELLSEYDISPIEVTNEYILFSVDGQPYKIINKDEWIIRKYNDYSQLKEGSIIEITGFYDEIAWYSKMIGRQFEVIEITESDVKVKHGKSRYSYYVGLGDFKIIA